MELPCFCKWIWRESITCDPRKPRVVRSGPISRLFLSFSLGYPKMSQSDCLDAYRDAFAARLLQNESKQDAGGCRWQKFSCLSMLTPPKGFQASARSDGSSFQNHSMSRPFIMSLSTGIPNGTCNTRLTKRTGIVQAKGWPSWVESLERHKKKKKRLSISL